MTSPNRIIEALTPKRAMTAYRLVIPVSRPISTIISEALTEYSTQRATLSPRRRLASYHPRTPGAATSRWSAAARNRNTAMPRGRLKSKNVVVTVSGEPGGPVCTAATIGMANEALMTRMTTPWTR